MDRTEQRSGASLPALVVAFLAGVIVALGAAADERHLELGLGYCHSQRAPDGIWHESQFPEHNEVNAACGQIALRLPIAHRVGVRLAYTDFGQTSSDAIAVGDESLANQVARGSMQCTDNAGACRGRWQGRGGRDGFSLGLYGNIPLGAWRLQPEIGLLSYRYRWHEVVTQYEANAPTLIIEDNGRGNAPYFAASLARGPFFARLAYFNRLKGGITQGSAVNLLAGVSIPF